MANKKISPILTAIRDEAASAKRDLDEKMTTQREERERLKSALRKLDADLIPLQTRSMAAQNNLDRAVGSWEETHSDGTVLYLADRSRGDWVALVARIHRLIVCIGPDTTGSQVDRVWVAFFYGDLFRDGRRTVNLGPVGSDSETERKRHMLTVERMVAEAGYILTEPSVSYG